MQSKVWISVTSLVKLSWGWFCGWDGMWWLEVPLSVLGISPGALFPISPSLLESPLLDLQVAHYIAYSSLSVVIHPGIQRPLWHSSGRNKTALLWTIHRLQSSCTVYCCQSSSVTLGEEGSWPLLSISSMGIEIVTQSKLRSTCLSAVKPVYWHWVVVKENAAFIVRCHTMSLGQLKLKRPEIPNRFQQSIFFLT